MRRVALFAVLAVVWLAARPQAQAYKCILTNKCDLGLPCEFLSELKLAKAKERAWAKLRASRATSGKAVGAAINAWEAKLTKANREYAKCSAPLPTLHVGSHPDCEIGLFKPGGVIPRTLEELKKSARTCEELVEAEYEKAKREQDSCQNNVKGFSTPAALKAQQLWEEEAKIRSLKNSLFKYLRSCAPDGNLARELSQLGLNALLRDGRLAREWEATRAVKRSGQ